MSRQLDQAEISEVFDMLRFFRISTEGLNTVNEMRAKLRDYLEGSCKRKIGETHKAISDAGDLDTKNRKKLQNLYVKTAEFLDHLDTEFIEILQTSLGDLRTTLEDRMKQVEPRDQYIVLVAGETSAGKSSVINLILGEDLLPHAVLSTTSTICELKYGVKPTIHVHFKDNGTQTRYSMMHELLENTEQTYQEQIDNFVNLKKDRDKAPYKKIELFFPHPLLKERVMIVDSPGVGESEVMSEFVVSYLPRAFCFMYVINSENAGGIQEDRLGILLKCAKSNLTTASKSHLAGCALFVCNKWDRIKPEEQDEVRKEQIQKLSKKIDNLDPKSQIVYLSCMTAQQAQSYGYITEDFHDLITGISNLLVSSMKNNLRMHYIWLEDFISRVSHQVKTVLKSTKMSRQETEKTVKRVMSRMEELKISQQRKFDELSEHQAQIIQEIIQKLAAYFKSDDTIKKFCEWSTSEAPEAKATWQETKSEVLKCISERTQQFVQSWEDDKHEFARAQVLITNYCSEKYDVMEEEIRQVEEEAFLNDVELEVLQHENERMIMLRAKLPGNIGENTPVWLRQGLSSVVVGSPFSVFRSKLKKKLQYRTKLEKYLDDRCDYMSKRSHKCLETIAIPDRLLPFINKQLADAVQFLKKIKEKISKVMEEDEKLYQRLLEDDRSRTQIQKVYEPVERKLKYLTGELTVYNLIENRESDFTSDELKWDGNFESIIGYGRFSTVYKGALSRSGESEIEVALKVFRDPLTANNVWHFADEEHALRKLRHPHIVKFYGASLIKKLATVQVMLVMEKCKGNLKSHLFGHPESIPGRSRDPAVAKNVCQWLKEITDALAYIHEQDIVHRDLKLENILVTEENSVKVSDVGVSKPAIDVTGTLAGTPVYIAPEVFHSEVYDCKADIYSLGIMLWEMWYGEQAFANVYAPNLEALFNLVDKGHRPGDVKGCEQPPLRWKQLMNQCWDRNPNKRPAAGKCYEEVTTLSLEIMSCMNPITNYNTATQVHQPSIEKGESLKSLDDSKSAWQMGNSNCETDHIPFKKANGEFLNRPKQKDNPEIGTAMKPGEYLKPQDILNRVETVIAKYAFLPQHEDDLGFKKGDSIIVLEKREDGWWRGCVEQKEGWFPSNCILVENESTKPASKSEPASALVNQSSQKEITCERQIPPFLSEKWFWGDITRVDAEKLMKETAADGDFLVRESKSKEGAYAISVKAVGKIKHFKVTLEDGTVKGGASINFNSLQEFIQHFKRFPIFTDKDGNKMFLVS